jgi:hypothetical protein
MPSAAKTSSNATLVLAVPVADQEPESAGTVVAEVEPAVAIEVR